MKQLISSEEHRSDVLELLDDTLDDRAKLLDYNAAHMTHNDVKKIINLFPKLMDYKGDMVRLSKNLKMLGIKS